MIGAIALTLWRAALYFLALVGFTFIIGGFKHASAGTFTLRDAHGGSVERHAELFEELADQGHRVVIEGMCASACTMVARVPLDRVCARKGAYLIFHSSSTKADGTYSQSGTLKMTEHYPDAWRAELARRGWDGESEHNAFIRIPAAKLLRRCRG